MRRLFKKGEMVRFRLVNRTVKGVITEDRGNLGVRGRRVYSVRVEYDSSEPMNYELEETDFIDSSSGRSILQGA